MLDAGLRFTAAGGDTVTGSAGSYTTLTNVIDLWETSSTNPNTDAWGSAKLPEIGGIALNVEVDTAIVSTTAGAGIITFNLMTHSTTAVSSGTTVASIVLPGHATSATDHAIGVRKSLVIGEGLGIATRYLGIVSVHTGQTVSAGAIHAFLTNGSDVPG